MAFLFFMLAAVCAAALLHPFVFYPLTLRIFRRCPLTPAIPPAPESFAICVCAYNEEAVIRRKAENLVALKRVVPSLEILVYVDAATDRTAAILKKYSDVIKTYVSPIRHGKTHGMNFLVSRCTASVVIFSDANVMVDPAAIAALEPYFADPSVGCVCGHLRYLNADGSVTASNGSIYWRLEEKIKQLESDTGSAMGADGSLFAIRRRLHRPVPDDIIDDMFVSLHILCDGYRVVRAPNVLAYEKPVYAAHEEFRRKIRIACQAFNVHRLLWPRLRRMPALDIYKYLSHKLLRWFAIYWLILAVVFAAAGLAAAGYPALAVGIPLAGFLLLWAGLRFRFKPVPQLWDILVAFAGTGVGLWRSLKGDRFQVWRPALSIRRGEEAETW